MARTTTMRRLDELEWVAAGDRVLATFPPKSEEDKETDFEIIELFAPARRWSLQVKDKPPTSGAFMAFAQVMDGDVVVAYGRAVGPAKRWLWGDTTLTTALSLHPDLDLDQRVVVLLAMLRWIGPPTTVYDD